jgi:hypothetical protein
MNQPNPKITETKSRVDIYQLRQIRRIEAAEDYYFHTAPKTVPVKPETFTKQLVLSIT